MRRFSSVRRLPCVLALACAVIATSLPVTGQAREILGWVEWLVLEPSGLRLKARLDTGANTSSLHAIDVEPFERDGDEWVRFRVPLTDHKEELAEDAVPELTFKRPVERKVRIKSKGGTQSRFVVELPFCISGRRYETQFTLTDRHEWNYPALLGRRFLDDVILVDSSDSFLAAAECDWTRPADLRPDS
ncbi:MAG: ATP-dependent zinc protease [Halofilum sp. (in: g-proteobacteria)]